MAIISTNAIFLGKDGRLTVRNIDEEYKPSGQQTLVRVSHSAINPADQKHFFMGVSGYVAGYEWIGTAIDVGQDSPFRVGQKLFGMSIPADDRPLPAGAHQDFLVADPEWTYVLPDNLDEVTAVGLPIAVHTSIDAIFNMLGFSFKPAGVTGLSPVNVPILIWGGGSCVGQAGIQLAKAAGFAPIITTASPRNHDFLKSLGATHCFDYRSTTVVQDIQSAVAPKKLTVVYDAVSTGLGFAEGLSAEEEMKLRGQYSKSSPALARQCCDAKSELKLVGVLPVPKDKDPDWMFPLPFRQPEGFPTPSPKGLESLFEGADPEWGVRMRQVWLWALSKVGKGWQPFRSRLVRGIEPAIETIHEVAAGKAGGEKMVIEHPL
ncbi:uncharacterized protein HMPREF1541_07125 [Cyphellophora europaea CBS 101466]|uniref:Enoyl reductase (ER) domain-containing protein n=1 Tax=Cyphellophora europaea (strain CBS 101466) TaxID=1220924 RepID=W2RP89_CYPE1|nr:uncharacterized protein HMPREF1541_07125 [Cyphellophora europaea CBS 101466]ETN37503.1 hypothetical protein HMPREF1541_07125 [Cyphellophora europaea CBS 101466]